MFGRLGLPKGHIILPECLDYVFFTPPCFHRLMRISHSAASLCFVIDTTGSMGDDISVVRETTSMIIDSKRGTPDEPSAYFLVPFNDPGPVPPQ